MEPQELATAIKNLNDEGLREAHAELHSNTNVLTRRLLGGGAPSGDSPPG